MPVSFWFLSYSCSILPSPNQLQVAWPHWLTWSDTPPSFESNIQPAGQLLGKNLDPSSSYIRLQLFSQIHTPWEHLWTWMFFLPYCNLSLILLIPTSKKITKIQLVLPLNAFLHQQFLICTNSRVFLELLILKVQRRLEIRCQRLWIFISGRLALPQATCNLFLRQISLINICICHKRMTFRSAKRAKLTVYEALIFSLVNCFQDA